jgi:anti-anti-sigma factor
MKMELEDMSGGVTRIALDGDLDALGANEIDLQFQAVASSRPKIIVDLARVGFLASIGIRTLIMAAKANARKGGKLVLVNPDEMVRKVLSGCGADSVLSIEGSIDSALAGMA